jgi:hypothetical protein
LTGGVTLAQHEKEWIFPFTGERRRKSAKIKERSCTFHAAMNQRQLYVGDAKVY